MDPKVNSETNKTVEQPKSVTDKPTEADTPASTDAESKSEKRKKADAPEADTNDSARKTDKAGTAQALTKSATDVPEPDNTEKQTAVPKPMNSKTSAVDHSDQEAVDKRYTELQNQIKLLKAEAELATAEADKSKAEQDVVTEERKAIESLLKAHTGNIPELIEHANAELRKKMGADISLELDNRLEFSKADGLRVPLATDSVNLDKDSKTSNFFNLNAEQQKELYDRIGLFRGIVVDHHHELPLEQSYRNIYYFNPSSPKSKLPVRVFYRKPRLSGYAESTYAFDESQKKNQESGIFGIGFGLSASFKGLGKSVAATVGYGYANERNDEGSTHEQKVSITSNFFLPKIELSLDTQAPVVHPDFNTAVEQVFADENTSNSRKFERLNLVLRKFGHFVATSVTVGGRIYSTETKTIRSKSQLHSFLEKKALDMQAAASGWGAELGGEFKRSEERSDKNHSREFNEKQFSQLNAVGGDGVFLNNPAKWVETLHEYPAWSLVKYDDLVPSLTLLSSTLQSTCRALLSEVVADPAATIEGLLEQNAHYLFYNGYLEPYGSKVMPRYFVLKGINTGTRVLSLSDPRKFNNAAVRLTPYTEDPHQQWWMTPNGLLRCRGTQNGTESYVLALNKQDELVINQEGYFENQYWQLAGGLLKNLGADKYMVIKDQKTIEIGDESSAKSSINVWQLQYEELHRLHDFTDSVKQMQGEVGQSLENGKFIDANQTLQSHNGKAVLRLKGKELIIEIKTGKPEKVIQLFSKEFEHPISRLSLENGRLVVIVQAEQGEKKRIEYSDNTDAQGHRLWLLDCGSLELVGKDGTTLWETKERLYSTLKQADSQAVLTIYHDDKKPAVTSPDTYLTTLPFVNADHQLWYVNSNKRIISKLTRDNEKKMALTVSDHDEIKLMPLHPSNKTQYWEMSDKMSDNWKGDIRNPLTGNFLSYSQDGQKLKSGVQVAATWEMCVQPIDISRGSHELQFHISTYHGDHQDKDGYLHFKNCFNNIWLADLDLSEGELRGLRLRKYGVMFGIEAILDKKRTVEMAVKNKSNTYLFFDKNAFWLDKSPVYLGNDAPSCIGLRPKAGEKGYALTAGVPSNEIKNNKLENSMLVHNKDTPMLQEYTSAGGTTIEYEVGFIDMTAVMAPTNERIVGFGFTKVHKNRLGLYLLTLKNPEPATSLN